MAIIIQDKRKGSPVAFLFAAILVVFAVSYLIYYLFFTPPPEVVIEKTEGYERATIFAGISLNIESITDSPIWGSLQKENPVPPLVMEIISAKTNLFESF